MVINFKNALTSIHYTGCKVKYPCGHSTINKTGESLGKKRISSVA